VYQLSCEWNGKKLVIETGRLAKQANGSVLVTYGETQILATVCMSSEPLEGVDFFPLTVEFAERFYAAGKIPGGFHKREGRPSIDATLSARLIDRPIRPLFPAELRNEVQLVLTVFSLDLESDVDVTASIAASAALHVSDIPFNGPTAACRIGLIEGAFVLNPTWEQFEKKLSVADIFVAGTKKAVMMVEGGAAEISEKQATEAILFAHASVAPVLDLIEQLRLKCGKPKVALTPVVHEEALKQMVHTIAFPFINQALKTKEKRTRFDLLGKAKTVLKEKLINSTQLSTINEKQIIAIFDDLLYTCMREMILNEKVRIDGRDLKTIRPISVETNVLKRAHGSALFTRGETQVLAVVTLGTTEDEQLIDTMHQKAIKRFMLHYNFPPYSVGEVGRLGNQSRREVGHGALAERSIKVRMPSYEAFPYTVRLVCETLESNGSSSMGSVCSASMALMDAGVPFEKPVAGIAMGLIKQDDQIAILSDILGDEDYLGDMDFKVAGTAQGITGIQMDIKVEGVDGAIIEQALAQAKEGRLHILSQMAKAIEAPRETLSAFAPRIVSISVPVDKIRDVIGSGGKIIKDIIAQTGCKIDIQDDGKISIASFSGDAAKKAIQMIQDLTAEVEVGKIYKGIVKKIAEFGAFVGVIPNQDGLLHISEIAHERVNRVEDYLKEGDLVEVKVLEIEKHSGKIRLSRKVLIENPNPSPMKQQDRIRKVAESKGYPDKELVDHKRRS
jgi:polyribonucleotide nucleotidyltransferase